MRWFRVHSPRVAVAAMLSLAAAGLSAAAPHEDDCHDAACQPIAIEHDAAAHRITAPAAADGHAVHCLVCHWARSFRSHIESRVLTAPASEAGVTVHVEYFTAAITASAAQPPLRSPPSSALS